MGIPPGEGFQENKTSPISKMTFLKVELVAPGHL
jgi:hypothetical protein